MTRRFLSIALADASVILRGRWTLAYIASFFLIALSLSQFTVLGVASLGVEAIGRLVASIINVSLYLVSLASLVLSSLSIVSEREQGSLEWLCSEPISRMDVVAGKFLALLISLSLSTAVGYGLASWVLSLFFPPESVVKVVLLVPALILLIAVCTSIGLLSSVRSRSRVSSLGLAFGAWLLMIFIYDLIVITMTIRLGLSEAQVLLLTVLNPVESARLLSMYILDPALTMLGRSGALMVRSMGDSLPLVLSTPLVVEALAFCTVSAMLFRRSDLA